MKLEFSPQFFENCSNITSHENPYSGSQVVQCGHRDGRTDMTKLIVAFRNLRTRVKKTERWLKAFLYTLK